MAEPELGSTAMAMALRTFVRAQRTRKLVLAGAGLSLLLVFVSFNSKVAALFWFLCAASLGYAYFQAISLGATCVRTFVFLVIARDPYQVLTSKALSEASGGVIDAFTWLDPTLEAMTHDGDLVCWSEEACCGYLYAKAAPRRLRPKAG